MGNAVCVCSICNAGTLPSIGEPEFGRHVLVLVFYNHTIAVPPNPHTHTSTANPHITTEAQFRVYKMTPIGSRWVTNTSRIQIQKV